MNKTLRLLFFSFLAIVIVAGSACDEQKYFKWHTISPDGALCGNGSPYKFFVNPSNLSKNVLIYFEAGGACWDYASCTGATGIRGAANPNGVPDDYMDISNGIASIMSPFVFRAHPWDGVPTKTWTIIFVPYCTGDIHTGNNEIDYVDPDTGDVLHWYHKGHSNVQKLLAWMKSESDFNQIPKLMVTGCSAGGAGSIINYHFIREALGDRVGESILFNDSGPIYSAAAGSDAKSLPLHTKIRDSWNVDSILDDLPIDFNTDDFGTLNSMLAEMYPDDKLAHTQFTMDGNYSSYSYERFYDEIVVTDPDDPNDAGMALIHQYWAEDQAVLMGMYDQNDNQGYFIPYFRQFNESHCTCVLDFTNTDITGTGMDVKDYINDLLDNDKAVGSFYETPDPEELDDWYPYWDIIDFLMEVL